MKIEVWSDFPCPFCYIGKRRLEEALARFPHRDEVEVIYRSFELDPHAAQHAKHDMYTLLAGKYGMSVEQAKAMSANVAKQAEDVGLEFRFDTMIPTNSFDAHRLAYFAAERGKKAELLERVFLAYFTESKHIGDHETLAQLAEEVGLNGDEAAAMLASPAYTNEVRTDEQEAKELRIQGVPFFVVNRKYAISGAQPTDVFEQALQSIWQEEHPAQTNGEMCTDDACDVPPQNE